MQKRSKQKKESFVGQEFSFDRTTSRDAQKALEQPHHSEDGDNVRSQRDVAMPYSQSATLCTGSEISHFEIVESDKEESWCI